MVTTSTRLPRSARFLFALVASSALLSAQTPLPTDLDAWIEEAMEDWETPGLAVAVLRDGEVLLSKGYGVRVLGEEGRVDADTLFAVASNTKAFTATLLGLLVQEGKLSWDDRVQRHLPEFALSDPWVTREVTIRDLLCHRTGLPLFGGDHLWIGGGQSREHIVHQVRFLQPTASFRARYQYNNLMWLVAGQVFAHVSGTSWDDGMRDRLLLPLGMTRSRTSIHQLENEPNVARPHEAPDGRLQVVPFDDVDTVAPAAALLSSVRDMTEWMRLHLDGGRRGERTIIREDVLRELHTIQMPTPLGTSTRREQGARFAGYGLGWGITEYHGHLVVRHSGGLTGMISLQTLLPERRLGVIVLSNRAPNRLPWVVTNHLLDHLLEREGPDWNELYLAKRAEANERAQQVETRLQATRRPDTTPSHPLQDYVGTYASDLSGEARIELRDGRLAFDYKPRYHGALEHWHYDTFRVHWKNQIFDMDDRTFARFETGDDGRITRLVIGFYEPEIFDRIR
ncbi:MAG: serine hydrolase [Planctomycetes bacterium]|nr:serine hydrolase [Planctomycetota bacterium]